MKTTLTPITLLLWGIAWAAGETPYTIDPLILRSIRLKD
jgi:hypothetical protein